MAKKKVAKKATRPSTRKKTRRTATKPEGFVPVLEAPGPEHRVPVHANFANVSHSVSDFVLTFGFLDHSGTAEPTESQREVRIVSRVAMSPQLFVATLGVMLENLKTYQEHYPDAHLPFSVVEDDPKDR